MGRGKRKNRWQQRDARQERQGRKWNDSITFEKKPRMIEITPTDCTFLHTKCKGEVLLWHTPNGAFTVKACEGHSERLGL